MNNPQQVTKQYSNKIENDCTDPAFTHDYYGFFYLEKQWQQLYPILPRLTEPREKANS